MMAKDVTAHQQGRRHMVALAGIDETIRAEVEADCFKIEGYDAEDTSVKSGRVPAATSFQSEPEASAAPASTIQGMVESPASSKTGTRAQKKKKKKGKSTAQPKKVAKGIVPPPRLAESDGSQFDEEDIGYFVDSYPSDTYFSDLDYSICDKDCGWCGKCMDGVSFEYV